MPTNPRGGGVSRRIEGEERNELRDTLAQLDIPEGMSLIARTAGIGRTAEEFQWDLNYLLSLWKAIDGASTSQKGAFLIYQEGSLVIRAIRDYFSADIGEILIDTQDIFDQAQQFMAHVMPDNVNKVKLYHDDVPLFSRFQIEHQIESAYSRQVNLPSGGAIVIDHTEALVSVDVNSARATKGSDVEQTATATNLEAADEVARQMRLRDLGGLIVIDFIDMENPKNQREVENRLKDALHYDRARVQTGKISRFGLLELSRQRLQPSLGETSYITCPRCAGTGHVRSTESFALHLLRMLQEEAMKDNTGAVHLQLPVDVATFLLNEKRHDILAIEARHRVEIVLIPNMHFETPRYNLARFRHDQLNQTEPLAPSYRMVEKPVEVEMQPRNGGADKPERPQPVVQGITPSQPAPAHLAPTAAPVQESAKPGLFSRLFGWLRSSNEPVEEAKPAEVKKSEPRREREPRRGRDNRGDRENREGRGERKPRGERPERGEQSERPARGERQEAKGERQEQRENREPRGDRPERQERPRRERQPAAEAPRAAEPRPVASAPVESSQVAAETPAENGGEERDSRRRGRRGGRGRRAEGRPESAGAVAEQTVSEIVAEAAGQPVGEVAPVAAVDNSAVPLVIRLESAPEPVKVQPAAESKPASETVQVEVAQPEPVAAPSALPTAELAAAGLQLVETVASTEAGTTAETEEQAATSRRRRSRGSHGNAQTAAERLVMVETRSESAAASEPSFAQTTGETPSEWGPPSNPRRRARPKAEEQAAAEPLVMVETKSAVSEQNSAA
jgi:ribonuclease E